MLNHIIVSPPQTAILTFARPGRGGLGPLLGFELFVNRFRRHVELGPAPGIGVPAHLEPIRQRHPGPADRRVVKSSPEPK
jgi:hypothetical protein